MTVSEALELDKDIILLDSHNGGRLWLNAAHNMLITKMVLTCETLKDASLGKHYTLILVIVTKRPESYMEGTYRSDECSSILYQKLAQV